MELEQGIGVSYLQKRIEYTAICMKQAHMSTRLFYKNLAQSLDYCIDSKFWILAPKPKTTGYGIDSACFLGSKIWHAMPSYTKECQTLNNFKREIQRYDFDCSCRLCRLYICNLGFLQFYT